MPENMVIYRTDAHATPEQIAQCMSIHPAFKQYPHTEAIMHALTSTHDGLYAVSCNMEGFDCREKVLRFFFHFPKTETADSVRNLVSGICSWWFQSNNIPVEDRDYQTYPIVSSDDPEDSWVLMIDLIGCGLTARQEAMIQLQHKPTLH